jgi:hypothetical protein
MRPPLSRSVAEANLYIDLHPCECGEADFQRRYEERLGEHGREAEYSGPCTGCGRPRTFAFLLDDSLDDSLGTSLGGSLGDDEPQEAHGWSSGTRPSELLDAGEWLAVADLLAEEADEAEVAAVARETYAAAAAAIDEVLLLGPPEATHVPSDRVRSELGREVVEREPDRLRRARLNAVRRAYREASGESVVEPVGPPLQARSLAEETAYMQAEPCVCGALLFIPDGYQVRFYEERPTAVHRAPCDQCGRGRAFWFGEPRHAGRFDPMGHGYGPPDGGPSRLVDPGQWLLLAEAHAALAGETLEPVDFWGVAGVLASAVAALDEVLRFIPRHSGRVPREACWTPVGLALYLDDPARFERDRLLAARDHRAGVLAEFVADHPDPPDEPGFEAVDVDAGRA